MNKNIIISEDIILNSDIVNNQDIIWNPDVMNSQDIIWNPDVMNNQDIMLNPDVMNNQDIMWSPNVMNNQDIMWNSDVINNQDIMWNPDVMNNQDTMWNPDVMNNQDIMCNPDVMNNQDIMWNPDVITNQVNDKNNIILFNELSWNNKLTELKKFIDLNTRKPSQNIETERLIFSWVTNQLRNRKMKINGMLNDNIRELWDAFIKDYGQHFLSNEELWNNSLTELKKFIDLNKRKPLYSKKTEKQLTSWMCHQVTNRKTETNNMCNIYIKHSWDNFIKDYSQYFILSIELWDNNLTKLKEFIDFNKRKPLNTNIIEKIMALWLNYQLKHRKTKTKVMNNKDIRDVWDIFIKDYKQYFLSNVEIWTNNLIKLTKFIDLNKHKPSSIKKTEKVLYSWLNNQLINRKIEKKIMSNKKIRDVWDTFIEDYKIYF